MLKLIKEAWESLTYAAGVFTVILLAIIGVFEFFRLVDWINSWLHFMP